MRLENENFLFMTFCENALQKNLSVASFVDHPVHSPTVDMQYKTHLLTLDYEL